MPKILHLVPARLEDLEARGMTHMILQRGEFGFFDHCFTVHYPVSKTRVVKLDKRHTVIEYGLTNLYPKRFIRIFLKVFLLKVLYHLIRLIRKEKIDLIQAHDPYEKGVMAFILSKLTGKPWCVSTHSDYDQRYKLDGRRGASAYFKSRKLAKMVERFVLAQAPMVMPIRDSLGKKAIENGARPETIRIIPHGIDMTPFQRPPQTNISKRFSLPSDKKIISFVGRLSRENYVYDIIEIAARVSQKRDDFVILLVGGGPETEELHQTIIKKGLEPYIKMVGFQLYNLVIDIRLNSYIGLCLMAGFSLIEACAAGRPVLAYDVEWHYELVKNGETGYLIKEGNTEAVSAAILELLNNPQLAKRLGENARKLAIERHSIEKTSKIKIGYYQELMNVQK